MLKGLDPLLGSKLRVPRAPWATATRSSWRTPIDPPAARDATFRREGQAFGRHKLERFAFHARVARCFAVVQTGERRLCSNNLIANGAVRKP